MVADTGHTGITCAFADGFGTSTVVVAACALGIRFFVVAGSRCRSWGLFHFKNARITAWHGGVGGGV